MLLLDFDGVVSPYGDEPTDDLALAHVGRYRLLYRPDVIAHLNGISRRGLVELRWLTSWGQDARTVSPVLGLDDFPLLGEVPISDEPHDTWPKLKTVQRCLAGGTRFAWIDDDLTQERQHYVTEHYAQGQPMLLQVPPRVGLTAPLLDKAHRFLTGRGL
ncbi:hypothetical protein GCM10009718_29920 [Isoptericola halotolerans]|uniref:Secreted protein n=1 Tax=Isoptericola halotolerans TaxID=300560 RepID=A0ABX2A7B9_9MICO|nr:HAD domain-containing protein [Isoptericola halotolerans]NOV97667.1 hypothetical protein [Isoptericola halotolerans]